MDSKQGLLVSNISYREATLFTVVVMFIAGVPIRPRNVGKLAEPGNQLI
jgi:hypothetical protein